MYISSDPIGLAGNNPTLYGYVEDINTCLDIWGLDAFDIVPYGCKNQPNQNHHAILDVWASYNVDDYVSRASHNTTIELTKPQHDATKKVYSDWLEEKTGRRVGGKIDWTKISPQEIFNLSERMFDAARVPQSARDNYYREFNIYIYNMCKVTIYEILKNL